MTTPIELNLPFYELFSQLQKVGFPLGISDYNLLIEALETDIYSLEPASLKQLFKTIWVKNSFQKQEFEAIFEQLFTRKSASIVKSSLLPNPDTSNFSEPPQSPTPTPTPTPRNPTEKYFFFPLVLNQPSLLL